MGMKTRMLVADGSRELSYGGTPHQQQLANVGIIIKPLGQYINLLSQVPLEPLAGPGNGTNKYVWLSQVRLTI